MDKAAEQLNRMSYTGISLQDSLIFDFFTWLGPFILAFLYATNYQHEEGTNMWETGWEGKKRAILASC